MKDLEFWTAIQSAIFTEIEHKGENLSFWWDRLKDTFRRDTIRISKRRALRLRRREEKLQKRVKTLASKDPTDFNLLAEVADELKYLHLEKSRGAQARSGLQLAEAFETPNAYFYAVDKAKAEEKVFGGRWKNLN